MRPTNKLTELTVRQAKPSIKVRKLSDGGGMHLLLHPNGSKYLRMDYSLGGKQKTLSFGVWPGITLSQARQLREEAKKKIIQGIDPIDEKNKEELQAKEENEREASKELNTFRKAAEEWTKKQGNSWSEYHALTVFRGLENHVFPHIGERPISEIGTREMLSVLRRLEAAGKHEAAQRARQRCESVFR